MKPLISLASVQPNPVFSMWQMVENLRQELVLPSRNLSQEKRKKISAKDLRPSSASIGVTAVACVGALLALVVCLDLSNVCQQLAKDKAPKKDKESKRRKPEPDGQQSVV